MLFNRYREVTDRCLELGAKMDSLANQEGAELRCLLEEQAWLSKTIARQAKGALEQVRQSLGRLDNWIDEALALAEKALDDSGVPSDILGLEDVMANAVSLRDKAKSLVPDEGSGGSDDQGSVLSYNQGKIDAGGAEIRIDLSESFDDPGEIEKEIEAGFRETAISSPEPDISPVSVGFEGDTRQRGNDNKQGEKAEFPMTYRLSQDLVSNLEKKLAPDKLPRLLNTAVTNPVEPETAPAKKDKKKVRKRKK